MIIKIIKITLAILFFICLAHMPYGYYQLIRFLALIGFSLLAYYSNENGNKIETVIFIALAILFQPIIKITLGRSLWNVIDLIVGAYLVLSISFKTSNSKNGRTN